MNPVGGRRDYAWRGNIGKMDVRRSLSHATDKHSSVDLLKLQDKYNLKGFEFGNYTSNDDRHDFAIATKRSLEDLMFVLRTRNIGVDRLVGIAFGARGMGGRVAAHYEPCFNMINITKPHGAGTLAHEYGHALDFNLGRYIDQNKSYSALSGGSSVARTLESNTGGQLHYWTNKIVDAVKATDSFKRLDKAGDYWRERTEVFARTFEQYVCYALKTEGWTNQFLTGSWSVYIKEAAYLKEADFMKILPDMQQLVREISLFLNDKGKLVPRAYPTTAKKVVMPKPEKKKEPKVAAAKGAKKEAAKQPKLVCCLKPADLYRFCLEKKDSPKEILKGVYYSNGTAVSTDGSILAVFNIDYPKAYEGKIINKRGEEIKGKYLNWKKVMPKSFNTQYLLETRDLMTAIRTFNRKDHYIEVLKDRWVDCRYLKGGLTVAKKLIKGSAPAIRVHYNNSVASPLMFSFGSFGFILLMHVIKV